jgi:hypothetical protein
MIDLSSRKIENERVAVVTFGVREVAVVEAVPSIVLYLGYLGCLLFKPPLG